MPTIDRVIWSKFHVHRGDTLPYCGWKASRRRLAELFGDLGYTRGAEIGVRAGEYSQVLLQSNRHLDELICVDPWTPYGMRKAAEQADFYAQAQDRLVGTKAQLIRATSMVAVQDVAIGSLDFAYIDGLHDFENVMLDIIHWSHRVRRGGIVAGHDFCNGYNYGVIPAVEAYVRGKGIEQWYITNRDREPSWLWVKP